MLEHLEIAPRYPERVVVLGSSGFIARALIAHLQAKGADVRAIGRGDIDLAATDAGPRLAAELREGDCVVFLSAVTPDKGRGIDAFLANVQMGAAVSAAVAGKPLSQLVYVSSDAVYPFTDGATSEASPAEPSDLYGAAHRAREIMMQGLGGCPVAVLRPTMIYGAGDTHNSYGANRFRRMARNEGRITLFGGGEETRDHMCIDDIVALIDLTVQHRSAGTLNLVSGRSVSFADLAKMVASHFPNEIEIVSLPRQMPVTHRRFDAGAIARAFPEFQPTSLDDGIARAHLASD
jgi:nucleoside-diphosphate-sugar epimerase